MPDTTYFAALFPSLMSLKLRYKYVTADQHNYDDNLHIKSNGSWRKKALTSFSISPIEQCTNDESKVFSKKLFGIIPQEGIVSHAYLRVCGNHFSMRRRQANEFPFRPSENFVFIFLLEKMVGI